MDDQPSLYIRVLFFVVALSLASICVATITTTIQTYERNTVVYAGDIRRAEEEARQDEENARYREERDHHDAGYTDAGPVRAYPDGGMPPEDYVETCRQLCTSHRDHITQHPDETGEGVPHVISVNQAANSCICWRPDGWFGNHIENYYNWHHVIQGG